MISSYPISPFPTYTVDVRPLGPHGPDVFVGMMCRPGRPKRTTVPYLTRLGAWQRLIEADMERTLPPMFVEDFEPLCDALEVVERSRVALQAYPQLTMALDPNTPQSLAQQAVHEGFVWLRRLAVAVIDLQDHYAQLPDTSVFAPFVGRVLAAGACDLNVADALLGTNLVVLKRAELGTGIDIHFAVDPRLYLDDAWGLDLARAWWQTRSEKEACMHDALAQISQIPQI